MLELLNHNDVTLINRNHNANNVIQQIRQNVENVVERVFFFGQMERVFNKHNFTKFCLAI